MSATTTTLRGMPSARVASSGRDRRRWFNPVLVGGLTVLAIVLAAIILIPIFSPYSPTEQDFSQPTFAGPSWKHPLGTDNFGRDTLTRLAYGGRVDLVIAVAATFVTVIVGGLLGLIAGYFGGWFDTLIMRTVDLTMALPYLILVIAIIAVLGTKPVDVPGIGPLPVNIIYAIWLVGWVIYARIIRGEVLLAKQLEYVEAARVTGMGHARIMIRHILPNVITAAIVYSMADLVLNILLASSLSFLGLGQQPPYPEWGLMVQEARDFFLRDWRLMTYPGLAVLITGAAFGLIGDGLAQALRPKG